MFCKKSVGPPYGLKSSSQKNLECKKVTKMEKARILSY